VVYLKEYVLREILEGSGVAMKENLEERLQRSECALRALREAPRKYLERHKKELELLYCAVYAKQRIYSLCRNRGELGDIFIVSGLAPSPTLPQVEDIIERFGPNTLLLTEKDETLKRRGRRIPTMLKNIFPIRIFQEIVALYSLPSYDDIDPSPIVTLSFCIFFGFMFGDVGHGLMISAGAWFLARKGILKQAFASVIQIAGYSAAAFGFLYGSVFGSEELIPALWTTPMHGINKLLVASLVAGAAFLSLGIALNILTLRRKGRVGKMLFDCEGLAGLLFYWTALAAAAFTFTSDEGVPGPLLFVLAALFLTIMCSSLLERFFFGRDEEDEGGVVHTFSVLHALLSFVSNTASFVRLAAFALNHAGLSEAVSMLGDMVQSVPGGPFFQAGVLLAGNAVIVGLEGLIVFIQTLRLEYYEFFGKFYRGGGIPFEPAMWRSPE
ncbi:MAG: ATPase, partial [Synergistetes bacterium HGW-Synergistetes-2]